MRDAELRRSAIAMAFPLKKVWTPNTGMAERSHFSLAYSTSLDIISS